MAKKKKKEVNYFVQKAHLKKGALRKQLGVPAGRKIPEGVLESISEGNLGTHVRYRGKSIKITPKLKKRGVLAHTMRDWREDE